MLYLEYKIKGVNTLKSANMDETALVKIQQSMNKKPIDEELILNQFSDSDKFLAAAILGCYSKLANSYDANTKALEQNKLALEDNQRALNESRQLIKELAKDNHTTRTVNTVTLAKFFLLHEYLLEGYSLNDDNQICYEAEPLNVKSNILTFLSLDLELYFGNKDIHHSTLLAGIKRYFASKQKVNFYLRDFLKDLSETYLAQSKTKKRKRVPLKYLRDHCSEIAEATPTMIRSLMTDLGYTTKKDYHNSIYFVDEV